MSNVRKVVMIGTAVLLMGLPGLSAESELDTKAAKLFKVKWSSVTRTKTATVNNPEVASTRQQQPTETLQLSGQIEFLDPSRVLGTYAEGVVTQLVDGAGRDVNLPSASSPRMRPYQSLRYAPRPAQPTRWQTFMQSIAKFSPTLGSMLRVPSRGVSARRQLVYEPQPGSLSFRFDVASLDQAGSEIRRVKGYFSAVMAGSTESIDVPFEPNNTWVQLTPDVAVQVQEATWTGSLYRFSLQTTPQVNMSPMRMGMGASLPGRLVVDQQLIGMDGKPVHPTMGGMGGFGPSNHVGGGGAGTSSEPIKAFRFIIAVNPSEHKIPFELEHIPLPKP